MTTAIVDDTEGAMIYIIVVLCWYSMGMLFMLSMQILGHADEIEDLTRQRTTYLMRDLREHSNAKEILGE
jgi:hypothetical protein